MVPLVALLALLLFPVAVLFFVRKRFPQYLFLLCGLAFGAVASPASMGLYSLYFAGPIPGVFGMLVGLPLSMFHGVPGYEIALWTGLIPPRTVVDDTQRIYLWFIDGIFWALVYGLVGWGIDTFRSHRYAQQ